MKVYILSCFLLWAFVDPTLAQSERATQLIIDLENANDDRTRLPLLHRLAYEFSFEKPIVALQYWHQAEKIAEKEGSLNSLSNIYGEIGSMYADLKQNTLAIEYLLKAYKIDVQLNDTSGMADYHNNVGFVFDNLGDFNRAIEHYFRAAHLDSVIGRMKKRVYQYANIGYSYLQLNDTVKAKYYLDRATNYYNDQDEWKWKKDESKFNIDFIYDSYGTLERLKGNYPKSFQYYFKGLQLAKEEHDFINEEYILKNIAQNFEELGQVDSTIRYYELAMHAAQTLQDYQMLHDIYGELCRIHLALNNTENFRKFFNRLSVVNDSLSSQKRKRQLMHTESILEVEKKTIEIAELGEQQKRQRLAGWFMIVTIGLLIIVAILFFRNYRNEAKHNLQLEIKNRQIREEKEKVEQSASDLQHAQEQLIAKEKLAAMGKLTAGVAHELRNPLNFVHNVSDLLIDQLTELTNELNAENGKQPEPGKTISIAKELITKATTIAKHSLRADAIIVKMLQHTSVQSDDYELADFLQMLKENYHVALHNFRSQIPDFSVNVDWHLPSKPCLVKINAVAMSRALFNIFDNAFYALNEKHTDNKHAEIVISVETENNRYKISIKDNGTGMAPTLIAQVFEPFFTTKPAGKGNTGLGMSIAYEIIVKEHRGTISVESEEGDETKVIIGLPASEKES